MSARRWAAAMVVFFLCYVPFAALAQDTDGDGMPDAWENSYADMIANALDARTEYTVEIELFAEVADETCQ